MSPANSDRDGVFHHPGAVVRKNLKRKKRSCAMCKPHKTGHANRWKAKELARMDEDASEIKRNVG